MDEGFLTTEEVLDYLQVNLRTVYRLIKAGKIPAVRVGRQWRFRKRDIDAWLESQRPRSRARRRRGGAASGCHPSPDVRACWSSMMRRRIRDLLSKTLALAEYDVDLAPDGRTALERLRMIPYDLLITDLKMPGVDGLAVIREARRLKADIPVIIITGFSTEASAIEAVNLGVSGYLTKPFRVPRVLAAAAKASANSSRTELHGFAQFGRHLPGNFDRSLGACAENLLTKANGRAYLICRYCHIEFSQRNVKRLLHAETFRGAGVMKKAVWSGVIAAAALLFWRLLGTGPADGHASIAVTANVNAKAKLSLGLARSRLRTRIRTSRRCIPRRPSTSTSRRARPRGAT